jgi:O-antigen ligase
MIHGPLAVNNYYAFHVWKTLLFQFFVFLVISNFIFTPNLYQKFIKWLMFIMGLVGIVGMLHGGRVPGSAFLGDENDFALMMNMMICFAYFMSLTAHQFKAKLYYIGLCVVFLLGVIFSASRGGFVGLLPVVIFCAVASGSKLRFLLFAFVIALVFWVYSPPGYWDEMSTITEENIEKGTGANRWYLWKIGWQMFLDHPVIGVGQGNFPYHVTQYEPSDPLQSFSGRLHGGRQAHSVYFTLIPELGVVGVFLFVMIVYHTLKQVRINFKRNYKLCSHNFIFYQNINKAILGALLAYLFTGLFISVLYYPQIWLFIAFPVALSKVITNQEQQESIHRNNIII